MKYSLICGVNTSFALIQGDFMYRHHIELRVHLYVPKKETFTVPLKCIGVTWTIYTNLDVLQEKRVGRLLEFGRESKCIRFQERTVHKVHSVERKTSKRDMWSGRETDKNSRGKKHGETQW